MRGVVKCLSCSGEDVEIYGFLNGYKGLIYGDFRMLTGHDFAGILTKGGTILGSSRTPFKLMREPDENGLDKVEAMKQNYYKLKLDCMVILGGNGTHKTANLLREFGDRALRHGHDREPGSSRLTLIDRFDHFVDIIRNLRNENDIRTACHTGIQCQPSYLMSHHFHDKDTRMGRCRGMYAVDTVCRDIHRALEAECHVRDGELSVSVDFL